MFIILADTKQLIKASQAGNLDAFEELLCLYQDRVYSHCLHLTKNEEDAADLAQEVFIRAYKSITSFRGDADFGTWMHRIAVNLWINQRRSTKNKLITFSIDESLTLENGEQLQREFISPGPTPLEAMERMELIELIQIKLNQLPENFRMALVLRDIEGYTYEDIAMMLSCSLGTVKSRINRGRSLLKEMLRM